MPGAENRLANYKNKGKSGDELRKKRTEVSVELRKKGRDDQLLKRRNIHQEDDDESLEINANTSQYQAGGKTLPTLQEIVAGIRSHGNPALQLQATKACRQMLSKEKNPPIEQVINAGLVPELVRFLDDQYATVLELGDSGRSSLQFEAAWALTNIASGSSEQTQCVVAAGGIPYFINLLRSKDGNVCEQAVWALGNIAGDGAQLRDAVINGGVLDPLLALLNPDRTDGFVRNVTWTISNLCRNKNPSPPDAAVKRCLPSLAQLVHQDDQEILSDACWAFSYITDGTNEKIQWVIETGVVPRFVQLLHLSQGENAALITPCLRTLGNIVTGNDEQTQCVLEANALLGMERLILHERTNIQKEACWLISNVTAGTQTQIQAIIDGNLIPAIVQVLRTAEFKAQKEAVWAITNLTSGGTIEQIATVANEGVVPILCNLLTVKDSKVTLVILDGLANILTTGAKIGQLEQVCNQIEECEGLDKIEALQQSENERVYQAALEIIEKFFSEGEEESVKPEVSQNGFQFNAPEGTSNSFNF